MQETQEILLSSSPALTSLHAVENGSDVLQFKSGNRIRSATFIPPRNGCASLVAVLAGREILFYGFDKEAPSLKSLVPANLSCLQLSNSGRFLIAGSLSGQVYIWELSSGVLFRAFDAHLQEITCMRWTTDDAAFVSAGKDACMHVWHIADILNPEKTASDLFQPYLSMRAHTRAINDIALGIGAFPDCRLLSASDDGTCRLWTLSDREEPLLGSLTFGTKTQVKLVTWDSAERTLYAAVSINEKQTIVSVNLFRHSPEGIESTMDIRPGGMTAIDLSSVTHSFAIRDTISSIYLSTLSPHLLVGTSASQIQILSLPALQPIRLISPTKAMSIPLPNPVHFLRTMTRSSDLVPKAGLQRSQNDRTSLVPRPVKQLAASSQAGKANTSDECVTLRIARNPLASDILGIPSALTPKETFSKFSTPSQVIINGTSNGVASNTEKPASTNNADHAKMAAALKETMAINDKLWKMLVEKGITAMP